jgi:glutathione S-transferase
MTETPSFEVIGFVKQDRSGRVRWLLEELELSYESRFLDWRKDENESSEYRRLNPLGVVPTLLERGQAMIESGAICLYLADRYGAGKALAPDPLNPLRAEYLQWFFFVAATLDAKANELGLAENSPEGDSLRARIPSILTELRQVSWVLEDRLKERDYLVGNEFSVVDILAGNCFGWLLGGELPAAEFPALHSYVERLKKRPALRASGAIKS